LLPHEKTARGDQPPQNLGKNGRAVFAGSLCGKSVGAILFVFIWFQRYHNNEMMF